ncbi:MAG: DUF7557 family protein [Nitrosotalea sp.]
MTTIHISSETKKRLSDLGKKGQSYEDIVVGLISKVDIK